MRKQRIIQKVQIAILTLTIVMTLIFYYYFNQIFIEPLCSLDSSPLMTSKEAHLAGEFAYGFSIVAFLNLCTGIFVGLIIAQIATIIKEVIKNNKNNKEKTVL